MITSFAFLSVSMHIAATPYTYLEQNLPVWEWRFEQVLPLVKATLLLCYRDLIMSTSSWYTLW